MSDSKPPASELDRRSLVFHSLGIAWCLLLLLARVRMADRFDYVFLIWNLFLAFVPLVTARYLSKLQPGALALALLGLWLLFLPNSPYVLTDLIHLKSRHGVPRWFDLLLLLSFAFTALFAGMDSLRSVHHWLLRHTSALVGRTAIFIALFLSGFGVYLGRIGRWNSWDILVHPVALSRHLAGHVLNPMAHLQAWAFTMAFGLLLSAFYSFLEPPRSMASGAPVAKG